MRYDGASTFAQDKLRSWYPSGSAAWEFTKQTGDLGGKLTYGKLRAAYGEVGTQPNPYLTVFTFLSGGSLPGRVGLDPDRVPERVRWSLQRYHPRHPAQAGAHP